MGIPSFRISGLQLSHYSAENGEDDANLWGPRSSCKQYHAMAGQLMDIRHEQRVREWRAANLGQVSSLVVDGMTCAGA